MYFSLFGVLLPLGLLKCRSLCDEPNHQPRSLRELLSDKKIFPHGPDKMNQTFEKSIYQTQSAGASPGIGIFDFGLWSLAFGLPLL